ncbi:MAG: hypothetical protein J2P28_02220, partial [Actinobacteria bacterium]|nr:hypothetical protein [Actinomycetota bacterium]
GAEARGGCPLPWAAADLRYRVRQLDLASEDELVFQRDGGSLLTAGLTWPLAAERTAVLWLLEAA